MLRLVAITLLLAFGSAYGQVPNKGDLMASFQSAEAAARAKAGLGAISPSQVDLMYYAQGVASIRSGTTPMTRLAAVEALAAVRTADLTRINAALVDHGHSAAIAAVPAPPPPSLIPPDLVVEIDGDFPPTGFCHFKIPPKGKSGDDPHSNVWLVPWNCNDKTSTISVPFGLTGRICENDGQGASGWGICRSFAPGNNQYVGNDLNDKGTGFWAYDDQMTFYMTSGSDEVPDSWQIGATYDFQNTNGPGNGFGITFGPDGQKSGRFNKTYRYPLPAWCAHPQIWESTKNGDANWSSSTAGGVLTITLSVMPRQGFGVFGPNNWVGLGVRCKP